ncbi:MAG: hydrogenase iron-sulfur subunit [bacterium]
MTGNVQPSPGGQDIVVLYCQGCVAGKPEETMALRRDGVRTKLTPIPCTSKVEVPHLLKILERGVDGIQVVGCGESACRFLVGYRITAKRIRRARELLAAIGIGADRLGMESGAGLTTEDLLELSEKRAAAALPHGPNPMKEHQT